MESLDWFAPLPEQLGSGRYELHEKIGQGGVARVYRATDTRQGRDVAIKIFQAQPLDVDQTASRFRGEAAIMRRLRHPNLVRVFTVGKTKGYYWYAMEYLSGGSLDAYIKLRGELTVEQAITWMEQLLSALAVVHDAETVHRDVKPKNVGIDDEGQVRLLDFGLARHPAGTMPFKTAEDMGMGTIEWSAPEQLIAAASVTSAADIYACGLTLAFMLTGTRPAQLLAHLGSGTGPFEELEPALFAVIQKATSDDPTVRYADAAAMLEALRPWCKRGMGDRIRDWFRW